jgi:hypothetical protein
VFIVPFFVLTVTVTHLFFPFLISLAGRKKGSSQSGSAKDTNQSSASVPQPPSGHRTRAFTGSTPTAGGNGNDDDEDDDRRKNLRRTALDMDKDTGKDGRRRSNKKAKTADAGSGSKPQKGKTLPVKKSSSSKTPPVKKASSSKAGTTSKSKNSSKSTTDKAQKAAQQSKSKAGVIAKNASGPDPVEVPGVSGSYATQDDPVEKEPAGKHPLPPLPTKGLLAKLLLESGQTFPFNICASYPKCNHSTGLCDVESSPNFCQGGCGYYYIHRGSSCSFKGSIQGPASGPADVCVYCHLNQDRPPQFPTPPQLDGGGKEPAKSSSALPPTMSTSADEPIGNMESPPSSVQYPLRICASYPHYQQRVPLVMFNEADPCHSDTSVFSLSSSFFTL